MIYHINPSLLSFSFAEIISERKKGDEKEDSPSKRYCCFLSFYISDTSKPSKTQIHWKSRESV